MNSRPLTLAYSKTIFRILLGALFVLMLVLNFLTPMIVDDYGYATQGHSIGDAFASEYQQYMTWTGRSPAHLLLRIFLLMPKAVFNVCNAAMYVVLTLLVYKFANAHRKPYNVPLFLFCGLLLWQFVPVYGQVFLWETGSFNYLWGMTAILTFLFPYYSALLSPEPAERRKPLFFIGLFFLGVLAGWSNENTSFGVLIALVAFFIAFRRQRKPFQKWMFVGLAANVIGFSLLMLAPGNQIRAAQSTPPPSMALELVNRVVRCTKAINTHFSLALILVIVIICILAFQQKNHRLAAIGGFFAVLGILVVYMMIATPEFPPRSMFGASIFLVLALAITFMGIQDDTSWVRTASAALILVFCMQFVFTLIPALMDNGLVYTQAKTRNRYIALQKDRGMEDITLPMLIQNPQSKYNPHFDLLDITEDEAFWTNQNLAQYYGVSSLRGVDQDAWAEFIRQFE